MTQIPTPHTSTQRQQVSGTFTPHTSTQRQQVSGTLTPHTSTQRQQVSGTFTPHTSTQRKQVNPTISRIHALLVKHEFQNLICPDRDSHRLATKIIV
jgi:hypothetical protein